MKAAIATRFGGPDVLVTREVGEPVAGTGEVVIDVAAADVLFVETQIRRGLADWFPALPPYIPGLGVAGHVSSVGDQVSGSWVGRRVAAGMFGGGYAHRAKAPVEKLIVIPDGLGLDDAAALLHDGRTALGLLETTGVDPGDWVLVTAAAGGLGVLLIQLARAAGARVVAAARGVKKLDLARQMGAEATIDYSIPGWTDHVRTATDGTGPTVVFDGAGGAIGRAAFEIIAPGGRFSAHGAAGGGAAHVPRERLRRRQVTLRGIEQVQYEPARAIAMTKKALAHAATGAMRPYIGQTFSLEDAADAHHAVEDRVAIGKTLITRTA